MPNIKYGQKTVNITDGLGGLTDDNITNNSIVLISTYHNDYAMGIMFTVIKTLNGSTTIGAIKHDGNTYTGNIVINYLILN